jgi:cobyrinic acid a,c-diamide synthase
VDTVYSFGDLTKQGAVVEIVGATNVKSGSGASISGSNAVRVSIPVFTAVANQVGSLERVDFAPNAVTLYLKKVEGGLFRRPTMAMPRD